MKMQKLLVAVGCAFALACHTRANVVPTGAPELVLPGRTLADVQTNLLSGTALGRFMFPSQMTGYHPTVLKAGADGRPEELRIELQYSDSYYLKCIVLDLTALADGVWGRAVAARFMPPPQPSIGVFKFVNPDGSFNGQPMTLTTDPKKAGYGVRDLKLMPRGVRGPKVDENRKVADPAVQIASARGVIARFAGEEVAKNLSLEIIPFAPGGLPAFEIAANGRVLRGSTGAALARAFYTDVTRKGAGCASWSGNRFDRAAWEKPAEDLRVISPFRHHLYTQPCTASYSTAFWDEARWMKEIDWMALHGIDLPIAVIAYEAIAERVWRAEGLTDEEIESSFAGPAYLGFSRMGCIAGSPSRLPRAWREREIGLQHAVIDRLHALGMEPIVQGFAGIVPGGIRRLHPEAKVSQFEWNRFHTWFLHPDNPLFVKLGSAITREWEKEFGKCTYYLCDSFIEMAHAMPWRRGGHEAMRRGLEASGRNIYESLRRINPDAVMAFQGWIFHSGRQVWTKDLAEAFLSPVPEEKTLVIEMCTDAFNRSQARYSWHWDRYDGFFGRRWAWCTIPDYGGSTLPGGDLEFYANGHLTALASANRGNLFASGTLSEAIEVNDIVFEMIGDAGWSDRPIDTEAWLARTVRNRWGCDAQAAKTFAALARKGFFGSNVMDVHDRMFAWQRGANPLGKPTLVKETFAFLDALRATAPKLNANPVFRRDFAVFAAHGAGLVVEGLFRRGGKENFARAYRLLEGIDAVLAGHPTHDLRNLIARARAAAGGDKALADFYETDACRIITVWAPLLGDYASRVWSGLVKDYYLPRMKIRERQTAGEKIDLGAWELNWVEKRAPLSPPSPGWTVEMLVEEAMKAHR